MPRRSTCRGSSSNRRFAPGGVLKPKWASLIEGYPGRFVIGSDTLAFFDQYKLTLQRYYLILNALGPETARKVAHENRLALLPTSRSAGGDLPQVVGLDGWLPIGQMSASDQGRAAPVVIRQEHCRRESRRNCRESTAKLWALQR